MVDYTVLGVAALGLVGTLGAGAIGFAGPSWNDERIQRNRDRREARRALRLVAVEIWEICISLDNHLLKGRSADEMAEALDFTIAALPDDDSQWLKNRETLAALIDDQPAWSAVAWFYSSLETLQSLSTEELRGSSQAQRDRVQGVVKRLVSQGQATEKVLQNLIGGTNTAQEGIEDGS